ncbi:hypothetical protein EAE89_15830 [Photorhabdus heterorhabditis]|nr:hypothetical protein [Photorhabdus heterorhabditis]
MRSPAQPHTFSQRCVGQWWRIIGRSSALASVYLKKVNDRGFFQQILYFWEFFIQKRMLSTVIILKFQNSCQ